MDVHLDLEMGVGRRVSRQSVSVPPFPILPQQNCQASTLLYTPVESEVRQGLRRSSHLLGFLVGMVGFGRENWPVTAAYRDFVSILWELEEAHS